MASDRWKPIEPWLHRLMGFCAMLANLRLLLDLREYKQLPPENDRFPVVWVDPTTKATRAYTGSLNPPTPDMDEYWPAARAMDTLDDLNQYSQGGTVAWPFVFGAGVVIGWWLF